MDAKLSPPMTIHSVSAYLQNFDAADPPVADWSVDDQKPEAQTRAPEAPQIDAEALRREMETAFAQRLDAQKEEHERDLRLARAQWTEREAAALGGLLKQGLDAAFDGLRADVARVLAPFVSSEIARQTIEELIVSIRRAIANDRISVVTVTGPRDLIEKVGLAFADENVSVNLVESGDVDVAVDLSAVKMETRLAAWMRRLSEAEQDKAE